MEKTISPEERIRRAEEIYYRRKLRNNDIRMSSSHVTERRENRQFSLYKKMILQILICILIYLIFSMIKEANYLFSEDLLNKTKEILSTDMNFASISQQVENFFKQNQDKFGFLGNWWSDEANNSENQETEDKQNVNENKEEINNNQTETNDSQEQENIETQDNKQSEENNQTNETTGIGGASNNEATVETVAEESSKKTQMQIDAEYIKKNFSMVLPAKAKITSKYGKREPTEIVSENHQGIDIGVVVGTKIVSAMDGKVTLVSKQGDYGTHVKIENKDVITIYAHCSKILVKEGESVKKGQKIALSGNTGNTTGPHLHFEIRRNNRTIDPELILKWT